MNIEKLLQPSKEFEHRYQQLIEVGQKFLQNKKIAIVGLARNVDNSIENAIQKLVILGESAQDYRLVIFENDSTDHTKSKIDQCKNNNSKIVSIYAQYNRPQFGQTQDTERTKALAEYRNILKQYVQQNLSNYDFVIVTDMDFVDFSLNGCYNSFGWFSHHHKNIDAVAGNSFQYKNVNTAKQNSLWNYDSWAFRYTWWNQLSLIDSITFDPMLWFGLFIMPVGSNIIPVNSAFGGMTIYKTEYFCEGIYEGYDCEHVCFHYNIKQKFPSFQLVVNPSQIMLV